MNGDFGDIAPWKAIVAAVVLAGIVAATLWGVGSRRRLALSIGKWLAAAAGLVIGQVGFGLVGERELVTIRPLGGVLLTWIGLIVGLQLSREVVARVPSALLRWSALDVALATAVGAATVWILSARPDVDAWTASVGVAATLVATACLGWSPETRSLGLGHGRDGLMLATLVRAGAGLQAVLATAAFGVAACVTDFGPDGELRFEARGGLAVLATATLTAVVVGFSCWLLMERLARRPGERMVVTLGTIAILAGTAEWLHTTPLHSGLVCGAVLANLGGPGLRRLEIRLKDAELTLVVAVFLLAGLLLGPIDVPLLVALVGLMLAIRIAGKPAVTALARLPGPPTWPVIRSIARRPAPIAVAIAVGGVLLRDSQLRRTVLAATLITGLAVFLLHLVRTSSRRGGLRA